MNIKNKMIELLKIIPLMIILCLLIAVLCHKPIILTAYTEIELNTNISDTENNKRDSMLLNKPFLINNQIENFLSPTTRVPLLTHHSFNILQVGHLWIDEIVEVVVKTNDWYAIKYNGKIAYILTESLNSVYNDCLEKNTECLLEIIESIDTPTQINPNENQISDVQKQEELIETNDILYVQSSTLNIRKGPGTNFKKIGTLLQNDEVYRIGYFKNGWSKIKYNDGTAFVFTNYLSDKKVELPKQESVSEEMARRSGMIGRLTIPSVGVNVALFGRSLYQSSQDIVDAKDSAAYLYDEYGYYGMNIIADHKNQGFSAMKKSIPHQTYAYIDYGTHIQKYVCIANFTGHNSGVELVDDNYVKLSSPGNETICMYTCNDNWKNITITYWQPC